MAYPVSHRPLAGRGLVSAMARPLASLLLALSLAAPAAQAQTAVKASDYTLGQPVYTVSDRACREKGTEALGAEAEGLLRIEFERPAFWSSNLQGVVMMTYPRLTASSLYGQETGHMVCILHRPSKAIAEIAFYFPDQGLPGFRNINGGSRAETRKQFVLIRSALPVKDLP